MAIMYAIEGWESNSLPVETTSPSSIFDSEHSVSGLTIVIPIHNPPADWQPYLPANVPVIIVDDHSSSIVSKPLQSNVRLVESPYPQGKKHALHYGIELTQTPYVITTDCDTQLTAEWIDAIGDYLKFHCPDMLILPLKMSTPHTLLDALQETEYVALQTLTAGYAMRGKAVMCSGANLLVNREKWLASWNDIMPDVPSGDDMFMLHSFKKQKLCIEYYKSLPATLTIQPVPTLKALFRQRARWAGKSGYYTDKMTQKVGMAVLLGNFAVLACYPFVIFKWIIDFMLLWTSHSFFYFKMPVIKSFALSLVYPFYIITTIIILPFRKNKW